MPSDNGSICWKCGGTYEKTSDAITMLRSGEETAVNVGEYDRCTSCGDFSLGMEGWIAAEKNADEKNEITTPPNGDKIQQVIIVRKDLKMRRGKEIAQTGHATLGIFFAMLEREASNGNTYRIEMTPEMTAWKEGVFTKICVSVNSEEELVSLIERAKAAGLPAVLITDRGLTEFHGVPTVTCAAIGPAKKSDLDPLTGNLPLY